MKSFGRRPAEAPLVRVCSPTTSGGHHSGARCRSSPPVARQDYGSARFWASSPRCLPMPCESNWSRSSTRSPMRRRLQFSALEQARLAEELANDMIGYGPLEPLLRDDTISDIMVNGPATSMSSAPASWSAVGTSASATTSTSPGGAEDRVARRPAHRRIQPDGGRAAAGRQPRQRHLSAAGDRQPVHLDPQILPAAARSAPRWSRTARWPRPVARLLEIAARCRLIC